jgi:hypothetical protein
MVTLYTPREMLDAMNENPRPDSFLRNMLVSGAPILSDKKHIELDKSFGRQGVAVYNSRVGDPTLVQKNGYQTDLHVSPYVNEMLTLSPSDVDTREPGDTIYESNAGDTLASRTAKWMDDLEDRLDRLEEKQVADAIQTGQLSILNAAAGVNYTIDFGIAAGNKITLAGAEIWGSGTENKLNQIKGWAKILSNKGYVAGDMIMSSGAADFLLDDTDFLALLDNRDVDAGRIDPTVLADQRATFLGTLRTRGVNIRLYSYEGVYETSLNTYVDYMTSNQLCLIGRGIEIVPHYGKIENLKTGNFIGRRFPNMWEDLNGKAAYIAMESAPLNALRNPNAVVTVKVA